DRRRLLRRHRPAPGCDRGSDGFDRHAGGAGRRPGRRADQLRHAFRDEHAECERVSLPAQPESEFELLVQQPRPSARCGQQGATPDPVIARLLADIRNATTTTGGIQALTDPNLQRFTFTNSSATFNYYPTARVDLNLSDKHRLSGTGNYQNFSSDPDILNST